MMSRDGDADSTGLRRDFAHRAGLDAEAATIFAERQGGYRRGVPSVPPSYHRIGEGSWKMLLRSAIGVTPGVSLKK